MTNSDKNNKLGISYEEIIDKLNEKALRAVNVRVDTIKKHIFEEGESEGDDNPENTFDDPVLHKDYEREYLVKSVEVDGHLVSIKTLGVGKNKPVAAYIDGNRWELFAGPKKAEKAAKEYIESGMLARYGKDSPAKKDSPEIKGDEDHEQDETGSPEEEASIKKENFDAIKESAENQTNTLVTFGSDIMTLNWHSSTAIMGLYEALNNKNKSKFVEKVNGSSQNDFNKLSVFAINKLFK